MALPAGLCCPRDRLPLTVHGPGLQCRLGHTYPVVDGVPVLLVQESRQTIDAARASLAAVQGANGDGYFVETLGIEPQEKRAVLADLAAGGDVDPIASWLVAATSGLNYAHMVGRLRSYPIPELPLPDGRGRRFLDVGCSWGRWSVAAARKGYRPVGIDPSLGAVLGARRVARALGVQIEVVCGDARFLPFDTGSFDVVFSYSVLQHFGKDDARAALAEVGRVLKPGGFAKVQMAHRNGLRSIYHQARRGFREPHQFEVRYWSLRAMKAAFQDAIGPSRIVAEAFGGLGLLWHDRALVPRKVRLLLVALEALRRMSRAIPWIRVLADSVYVEAEKSA